jgi:hypothetical protein
MAASCIKVLTLSVVAAAALAQYRAVTGAGNLPAAGGRSLGVTDYSVAAGERVSVGVMGTVIAEAGGAFAVDALLEVDAQGRFITANTGAKVARAISAAGAAGVLAEILLIPN